MPTLLTATDLRKSFAGVHALRGVSFELKAGEVHALVGENGAGKSTLIKIITGAIQPDSGKLEIGGVSVVHSDPVAARCRGVAAVYQQPSLFPDLSVAENVTLGLEPFHFWRRINWAERRRRAEELLARVGADISADTVVDQLTMPEQQLVEIARALGAKARILILDEPTASLSDREVERLLRTICELKQQGVGIIYISHRLDELFQIADRVTVLRDGAAVATRPISQVDRAEMIRLMVGRELSAVFPKETATVGNIVLEMQELGCHESGVHHVNLTLRAGEIVGLAGLVGAGRTELAKVLFGLTPSDSGSLLLRGRPVIIDTPARARALGIAYVPEDRRRHGVILDLPIEANVSLAVLSQIASPVGLDFARERALASQFAQQLAIKAPSTRVPAQQLSGGNQQKVAVARWLATQPAVLILDEPTQGIDVGAKAEIHRLMSHLASRGMAILMISSELPEILGMSDRIAVLRDGTIVATVERAAATQEQILALALGHKAA